MNRTTIRAAFAATAVALVLPAAASAHPAIYEQQATIVRTGAPSPPTSADLITRREYYIQNDGRSIILQESNGLTDVAQPAVPANGNQPAQSATAAGGGMVNYKKFPSAFRNNTAVFPDKASWLAYGPARSDVQLHATCVGVPALSTPANIVQWQSDPFFNYIPWQKDSANLGDDPAKWIPLVKTLTGVDLSTLSTVADFTAACQSKGGTYYPADGVLTTPANTASASIADAVAPEQAAKVAAQKAAADAQAAQKAAEAKTATALAQVAQLQLAATPISLSLTGSATRASLLTTGQALKLTGPPLQVTTVRVLVGELAARRLGLRSRILATQTLTSTAAGVVQTALKPTGKAAAALRRHKGGVAITVQALSGQKVTAVDALAAG